MRRAFKNKEFIVDGDVFYGISLGWDFVSEHEWGIKNMSRKFGIDTKKLGVEGRKITKSTIFYKEDENLSVLTSYEPYKLPKNYKAVNLLSHDIVNMYHDLETAWDESDFCIATKNKEHFKYLRELNEAFKNNNIVITFLKSEVKVFSNASLSILILDKLPQESLDEMYKADEKVDKLYEYETKIGVTELKNQHKQSGYKKDKYFMACSPKWIDYENEENRERKKKEMNTQYDIMFWVNYSDDDDNFGWYTGEQIIQWLSTPGLKLKSLNK